MDEGYSELSNKAVLLLIISFACICAVLTFTLVEHKKVKNLPTHRMIAAEVDKSPTLDLAKVWQLVNEEREKVGLRGLARDPLLDKSAQEKCNDMVEKDYWSHYDPDGTGFWAYIRKYNTYRMAGENLAYGYKTEIGLVDGWMNSEGHRANILKAGFTNVGYAQCEYPESSKQGEATVVVQHFADNPTGS